jgi:hypothetical protein
MKLIISKSALEMAVKILSPLWQWGGYKAGVEIKKAA